MPDKDASLETGIRTKFSLMPAEEIRVVLSFLLFGTIWIIGTDWALALINKEVNWVPVVLQSSKGMAFVAVTAMVLYVTLRRSFDRRRRAEQALLDSFDRFELAALAATDAIYDWDLKSNHMWWSDSFHKLFGYSREEVEPNLDFWTRQLHPEEKEDVLKNLHQYVEKGEGTWSQEYRFRRRDGTYAFVQDRGNLMLGPQGQPLRMIGGMSDITDRKRDHERIEQSRRQLRALSARLQSSREEERTRISREIHDELGQLLTALKMDLRWLEKRIGDREDDPTLTPVLEKAVEASEIADSAIATVQKIASELRPGTLDNLGLVATLRHEAGKFQERTGVTCDLNLPEEVSDLPRDVATTIFRIFQETLTNVARHAKATHVQIDLRVEGDCCVLQVEDNGKGISSDDLNGPKSLGLLGMKERAAVLGGEFAIQPAGERGTRVTLRLPRAANDTDFWQQI